MRQVSSMGRRGDLPPSVLAVIQPLVLLRSQDDLGNLTADIHHPVPKRGTIKPSICPNHSHDGGYLAIYLLHPFEHGFTSFTFGHTRVCTLRPRIPPPHPPHILPSPQTNSNPGAAGRSLPQTVTPLAAPPSSRTSSSHSHITHSTSAPGGHHSNDSLTRRH
jgi:hypothetical protein